MELEEKVAEINRLIAEVWEEKSKAHPLATRGYYSTSAGSILNAYREGDLGFADAVEALEAISGKRLAQARECVASALFILGGALPTTESEG